MATTQQPAQPAPFGGQPDYSQYASWPKVIAPDGTVYYKVPGTGYLLNPFLSAAKGRPVLFTDPTAKAKEVQDQKDAQKKAQKQQEFNQSPAGQAVPVVTGIGGALVANEVYKNGGFGSPPPKYTLNPQTGIQYGDDGSKILANGVKVPPPSGAVAPAPVANIPPVQSNIPGGITETNLPITQPQAAAQGATGVAPTTGPATPTGLSGKPIEIPAGAQTQPDGTVVSSEGVPIGKIVQGAAGLMMAYQGYQQYKEGDKIGGGLGMAAGGLYTASAANVGGATVADAAPIVGGIYGAYTLGNMAANSGDMHKSDTGGATLTGATAGAGVGAAVGSVVPVVGTAVGGVVGGIVGGLYGLGAGLSASSKGERQQIRDKYRENIIKNGVPLFGADYQGDLADGTKFDFGKDKFGFGTKEGDIDLSNPTVAKAAAYGNVLGAIQGATGKGREAIATQFLSAAKSNAGDDLNVVKQNYAHFLNKLGVKDLATAQAALDQAKPNMSDEEYQVFSSDLKELYQPAPAKSNTPAATPAAPGFNVGTQPTQVQAAAAGATKPKVENWMRMGRT